MRDVLPSLVRRYRLVAIITGRRSEEAAALLEIPGLVMLGLYGFEDDALELLSPVVPSVERVAGIVPRAWVEDKGGSVAVHYRQAPDPAAARAALMLALQPLATEAGLELIEGKMVLELVPPDRPMKGGAVERLASEHDLQAVAYAGDDHADLDAFAALGRLAERGLVTLRIAVRGDETPPELVAGADLVVDGPSGLVELLRSL